MGRAVLASVARTENCDENCVGYSKAGRVATREPPARGDDGPHSLNKAEWPSALQEAVGRAERAGHREGQNEPGTSILGGVADEHHRHREQAEQCERIHRKKSRHRLRAHDYVHCLAGRGLTMLDSVNQGPGAAAAPCRRARPLQRRGMADQLIRAVAGAGRHVHIVLGLSDGTTRGGHLLGGIVRTCHGLFSACFTGRPRAKAFQILKVKVERREPGLRNRVVDRGDRQVDQ